MNDEPLIQAAGLSKHFGSFTAIRDVIQPDEDPLVFQDTSAAKQALQNGQVDAIVVDATGALHTSSGMSAGRTPARH